MPDIVTVILIYGLIFILIYTLLHFAWIIYQNQLMKKMLGTGVLLEVVLEKETETETFAIEQFWSSFYGLRLPWHKRIFTAQPHISFEIKSENSLAQNKKEITFNFWVPDAYVSWAKSRLMGLYPTAQIRELKEDYIPAADDELRIIETVELGLREDSAFSIKTFQNFETDPLASITAALANLDNKEIAVIQVMARPHDPKWRAKAERTLNRFERTGRKPNKLPEWTNVLSKTLLFFYKIIDWTISGLFMVTTSDPRVSGPGKSSTDSQRQKEMLEKVTRNPIAFQVRIMVGTPYGQEEAKERVRNIVAAFSELEGIQNGFKREFFFRKERTAMKMRSRYFSFVDNDDILSTVELAGFAHLPNKNIFTPGLKKIQSKRTEFDPEIATENAFAYAMDSHGSQKPVGLDLNGRMRHVYVSGMTGVGKSTLLENMIVSDIESGKGVVVVDPHGELVDEVLAKISTDREDIFVLDPSDMGFPFGMNMLEISSTDPLRREMEKILVIDAYITTMKRVFGESSIGEYCAV